MRTAPPRMTAMRRRGLTGVMIIGLTVGGAVPSPVSAAGPAPTDVTTPTTDAIPAGNAVPVIAALPMTVPRHPTIKPVDIHLSKYTRSAASDLNDRGDVIGYAVNEANSRIGVPMAFQWRDGVHTVLQPVRGGLGSLPYDINERGDVVGFCEMKTTIRPCLWRHGRVRDMGDAACGAPTMMALNDKGEAVGGCNSVNGASRAVLWRNGAYTLLGGSGHWNAIGINNRTQIIGTWSASFDGSLRGFLWQRGRMTDLGTLGGDTTRVSAINDRGQIVGESTTADGMRHGFLWQNGRMTDLGTLPGDNESGAITINERGQVMGWSHPPGGIPFHSVLWNRGVPIRIGTLTAQGGASAQAINHRGQVGGSTRDNARDRYQVFLWQRGRLIAASGPTPGSAAVTAVNNTGLMTGWVTTSGRDHATVWRVRR